MTATTIKHPKLAQPAAPTRPVSVVAGSVLAPGRSQLATWAYHPCATGNKTVKTMLRNSTNKVLFLVWLPWFYPDLLNVRPFLLLIDDLSFIELSTKQ